MKKMSKFQKELRKEIKKELRYYAPPEDVENLCRLRDVESQVAAAADSGYSLNVVRANACRLHFNVPRAEKLEILRAYERSGHAHLTDFLSEVIAAGILMCGYEETQKLHAVDAEWAEGNA